MTFSFLGHPIQDSLEKIYAPCKNKGTWFGVFTSDEVNLGLTCLLSDYFLKLVSLSRYSLDVYKLPFAQILSFSSSTILTTMRLYFYHY